MSKADNQRSRIYGAEQWIRDKKYQSKLGEKMLQPQKIRKLYKAETNEYIGYVVEVPASTKQCKAYMEKVVSYEWFTARWRISTPSYVEGNAPLVGDGRARRNACWDANSYEIKLPQWARTEAVILHEMAHWIVDRATVPREDGQGFWRPQYDRDHAAHGIEFAAVFLELVRLQLGAEATKALKDGYKVKRVKRDKQPQPIHRKAQKVA
jgi:putative metallohydrolase (TIGR04338 family)